MYLYHVETLVLGRVIKVHTPKDEGDSTIEFTDGSRHLAFERISSEIEGLLVLLWANSNADAGVEEVELINDGQTVKLLQHRGGQLGFGIDFHSPEIPIDFLKFIGLEIHTFRNLQSPSK